MESYLMKVPFCIPDIDEMDKIAVNTALGSQWLTGGQMTEEFEKRFASYIGVSHAVAVNSCTAALHLSMRALDVGIGDEVIVPTLTFAATANAPIFCGAKPVFADIDGRTFNISARSIEGKITKKTKAVIPVHYGGQSCDMGEILRIALENNLFVVEDCAHSLGTDYMGAKTGSMSNVSCFSFYATKPLATGEGGMIATNSKELARCARLMRSHCMTKEARERRESSSWFYDIEDVGYNYRMTEMQAALGISQLVKIDAMNKRRVVIARMYTERLGEIEGIITPEHEGIFHLYVIRVIASEFGISRDELFKRLATKGVECSVHYTPLHLMSYYQRRYGCKAGDYPIAEKVYGEILSLPIYSKMSDEQVEYVVDCIKG